VVRGVLPAVVYGGQAGHRWWGGGVAGVVVNWYEEEGMEYMRVSRHHPT